MGKTRAERGKKQDKGLCLGMKSGATNTLWAELVAG